MVRNAERRSVYRNKIMDDKRIGGQLLYMWDAVKGVKKTG
jgi:hypothetical protein